MKMILLRILALLVRWFGWRIRDVHTGKVLGRAFLIPWRGRIHYVGNTTAVRAVFVPQPRMHYWRQELGFTAPPPVDFPHEPSA
jgi:hypothetical protein